jgi:hypothetical protein
MTISTEHPFTLPRGYLASDGTLHRRGVMRLATARDEIEPLRDPRVQGPDDPYLTIIVLSRVISQLGTLGAVTPKEVEGLFAADLAFLQDLYGVVNFGTEDEVRDFLRAAAPAEVAPVPEARLEPAGEDDGELVSVPETGRRNRSAVVEEVTRRD